MKTPIKSLNLRKTGNVWGRPINWWVDWVASRIHGGTPEERVRERLEEAAREFGVTGSGFVDSVWRKFEEKYRVTDERY